ncbi:SusC/RagA family TonB-linked outer membrane protein [Aquimarina longa]|uniref:SusC/RagA family TonB-linked outer membrane protein n=1 Tax=Aquimarina longa TaxID=1080221 RepID=UPI000782DD44|nr:TonB-dependent receptor [Aquimarina longa]
MRTKFSGILTLFLAFVVQITFAQEKTISGTVTDDKGLPLPGVNVVVRNTANGTQTDFDGNYTIMANRGAVLSFSYVGFETKDSAVQDSDVINVQLVASAAELEEVVIQAFGAKSRTLTTTAISSVAASDVKDLVPSTGIDNMLQGKAAGVQVTAANGRPGQTAYIQIRGIGSLSADTSPLYIVDGIPMDDDNIPNINPNDIENFSILKDAASSALYGSRAANGVVLITTKQGKTGQAKIIFRSSIGSAKRIKDPFDLMNASQKLELERQYAALGVTAAARLPGATASEEERARLISYDTDWEEELLRNSYIQSNSLSISGGSEKFNYFLSLGYDKNSGIIDRIKGYERISTRLNTSYQAKDWLRIGANVAVSRFTDDRPRDRNNVQNPFRGVYDYNPYDPLYSRDDQGNIVLDGFGNPVISPTNTGFPIARAITTEPDTATNLLTLGNLSADITLSENFSNSFKVGVSNRRFNRYQASLGGGVLQQFVGSRKFPGTQRNTQTIDLEFNISNILSYQQTFGDAHNFGASFLVEYFQRTLTSLIAGSRGFPSPDINYQIVAAEPTQADTDREQNAIFGQALLVDYDYDSKYILSGSIRRDGSTRFGPKEKYGYFYSGSAAWNLAKENFLSDSFFNDLKLRVSYGTAGNDNIDEFLYLNLLSFNRTYNGESTALPTIIANPDIKWESQSQLNIGLEFGLWNNRITGAFDYYIKKSDDLLLPRPISATVGGLPAVRDDTDPENIIVSNVGEIENRGFEFGINADIIRNENLKWTVGGTMSIIDNEVKKLVGGQDITSTRTILREGEEINSFFLVRYAGVDPNNGKPLFLDLDGNVTDTYSASNAVLLKGKSPQANLEGGFYTTINYKGFGLRTDFVYKSGNYILNNQRSSTLSPNGINRNQSVDAFNYWKKPGDTGVLPSPLFGATSNQRSDRFLQKGDYIRLRNVTLSYDFPETVLKMLPISGMRIYAQGQNLWTITKYEGDPEIGLGSAETSQPGDDGFVAGAFSQFSYPQVKSYTVGLDIEF